MAQFVAVRMIIVDPEKSAEGFEAWMTGTFLGVMWNFFKDYGLERLTFLKGNKREGTLQSRHESGGRENSTPAGANADYAWITRWTSWEANNAAWKADDRPEGWDDQGKNLGLWNQFRAWCHPKTLNGEEPVRPLHGPAFDYRGAPGYLFYDEETGHTVKHIGRGAGCLVEGFVVLWERPEP